MAKLNFDPSDFLEEVDTESLIEELAKRGLTTENVEKLFNLQDTLQCRVDVLKEVQVTLADQMKLDLLTEILQRYTLQEIEDLVKITVSH